MFLGIITLGSTLVRSIQLKNGNAPVTADAQPTFRIYSGATLIASGTCSTVVDSQTGLHSLTQAATVGNGFSVGAFTVRVAYNVSSVAKVQDFSFQVA